MRQKDGAERDHNTELAKHPSVAATEITFAPATIDA